MTASAPPADKAAKAADKRQRDWAEAEAEGIDAATYGRRWWILIAMCTSLLVVMLANSSLNLALPGMTADLGITTLQQTWVVDLYALIFASLLFTAGAVGDRYGRRKLLQIGLVVFTAASAYAGFVAGDGGELIFARGLMGLGAALVMPSTLSIINTVFPRGQRAFAIAIWTGIAGIGTALGSVLSGFMLEIWDWRSTFVFSVAIGVVAYLANHLLSPESRDEKHSPVDWLGGVLSTVGILGLVYVIIEAPSHGLGEIDILVGIAAALLGLGLFIWWQTRTDHPMLDLKLFRNPLFTISSIACTVAFFALMGAFFLMAQLFQLVLGYGTLKSSLLTLPIMLPMMVLAPAAPKIWARLGAKVTIGIGLAVIAVGFVLCSTWRTDSSYWHILGSLIVVVCGMALAMTPATNLILAAVPKNRSGMGSAMNDTVRELGGALGIAVLGAVISAGYSNGITDATAQLPPELAEAAEGSLATAVMGVAPALEQAAGPAVAAQFLDTALASWMSGLTSAMLVAAVLAALAAVGTFIAMPGKEKEAELLHLHTLDEVIHA
ncbi:MFS transporter [Melissospora conviva]|uniref:MFS transporter n=1 Tax=Melissospora conviva TaxID=3388432 RepID=UPI003C2AA27D